MTGTPDHVPAPGDPGDRVRAICDLIDGGGGMTAAPPTSGPDPRWLHEHPLRWQTWLAGFQRGVQDGIGIGRAQAGQEWTDATTAACRAGVALTAQATAERRRDVYTTPPLSADEIRRRAHDSWAALERELAREVA